MGCEPTHIQAAERVLRLRRRFTAILLIMAAGPVNAQESAPPSWFVDFSLYPYQSQVENDNDFTTTIRGNLPGRFSYFGYMNFTGVITSGSAAMSRSEQNIRYAIGDRLPLDFNVQGVFARGDGNDFSQVGVGWRLHDTPGWKDFFDRINLTYRMTFHLKRFGHDDSDSWGMEHFFRITFPNVTDRLYISGFLDQSFGEELPDAMPSNPVISEVQLGVRFWKDFYAVGEYRINQKRVGDEYNFAAGIEYKIRW